MALCTPWDAHHCSCAALYANPEVLKCAQEFGDGGWNRYASGREAIRHLSTESGSEIP